MFSSLSRNQRAHRFWNRRAEPDFSPENAASLTNHGRKPAVVPKVSTPRRRTDAAEPPVGILFYLVSVGLIAAAIIGTFFGTGFWLLASPASETIPVSGRDPSLRKGDAFKAGAAVSAETETTYSAAVNLIPGSPPGQHPAAVGTASPQQDNIMQEPSLALPNGEPPVETALVPQPLSRAAGSPAYPMPLATRPAVAAEDGAPSAGNRGPSARDGRSAQARTVLRHRAHVPSASQLR